MLTNVRFEDLKNIENVKTAVEHISLYVGLVVFTALGAKVGFRKSGSGKPKNSKKTQINVKN